ncbi:MAG: hypothetical protein BV458_00645 [Thermoplasmata archaeon M9B2D]|nr:MAG: hypothetical protein BV458_00645 [Thermoplasmata archaeon M9B2D]
MKNGKKCILSIVMLSVFGATVCSATVTGITFGEIISSPTSPPPISTVTFSIEISGGTPSEVKIWVQECNGGTGICYPDTQNVSMTLGSPGMYSSDVLLKHADATYMTCQVWAKTDGTWESSPKRNITLSAGTNGNGSDGDNKTPGFELLLFVMALIGTVILVRKKRVQ